MRYPQRRYLSAVARELASPEVAVRVEVTDPATGEKGVAYVPARGEGFASLENRIHCAWLVFTGQADALTWPEDDGFWNKIDVKEKQ